jgi:hypothetical protein
MVQKTITIAATTEAIKRDEFDEIKVPLLYGVKKYHFQVSTTTSIIYL